MASLSSLRAAIKTTLTGAISGLFVYDTIPDAVNLPAVVVEPVSAEYQTMGRGVDTWTFRLYVLVPYTEPKVAQNALDAFVTGAGPKSIRAAIFATRTLGLPDADASTTGMTDYGGQFDSAAISHIGAVLTLMVATSGTA